MAHRLYAMGNGTRFYDPDLGQFLEKDPLYGDESEPRSLSPYAYSFNNPVWYMDPTGLAAQDPGDKFSSTLPDAQNPKTTIGWTALGNDGSYGVSIGPLDPEKKPSHKKKHHPSATRKKAAQLPIITAPQPPPSTVPSNANLPPHGVTLEPTPETTAPEPPRPGEATITQPGHRGTGFLAGVGGFTEGFLEGFRDRGIDVGTTLFNAATNDDAFDDLVGGFLNNSAPGLVINSFGKIAQNAPVAWEAVSHPIRTGGYLWDTFNEAGSGDVGDAFGRASGQVGFDIVAAEIGGRAIPGRFQPPETIFNGVVPTATFTPTPRSWSLPVIQPTCFIAGTLIWTESGLRPIEDIKPGDKVLSFNETTHQTSYQAVEQTFVRVAGVILPITIGDDPIPIRTTLHHPFFVYRPRSNLTADVELPSDTDGQWIEAGELQVGDKVRRPNGQWVTVTTIGPLEPSETVYNFEVSKTHTYFVSANGVLVHNPPPNTYINWKGDTVTVPQGHILSPRDPLFSDPPIFQAGPFTTAQKDAFLKGKSGGTKLSPHHRHQVPTTHGSVIDELPGPGHSSGNIHTGGSPSRHPGPSVFYEMERNGQKGEALRKSEIKAHWQAKGSRLVEVSPGVWIDPGPK